MLKFFTPPREGLLEPYTYRGRARLIKSGITIKDLLGQKFNPNDVVVLGVIHQPSHVEYLIDNKIKFIHDICDNKWPEFEKSWGYANCYATAITTTCEELKVLIHEKSDRDAFIISDLTEREQEVVKFSPEPNKPIELVYYGSGGNYKQLDFDEYHLPNSSLTIVTDINENETEINYSRNMVGWSFEAQGEQVRKSDIVILPVDNDNQKTPYKGNNRPIDAIRQGRFVITNAKTPSWLKLKDYMWCGDIEEGYKWALSNPNEVKKKIIMGQKFVSENYAVDVISKKWEEIYKICVARKSCLVEGRIRQSKMDNDSYWTEVVANTAQFLSKTKTSESNKIEITENIEDIAF